MSTNPLDQAISEQIGSGPATNAVAVRKQTASQIIDAAINWPAQLANQLNQVMNLFWGSPDPQKLADEIDKQKGAGFTATLFQFHSDLKKFVSDRVPSLSDKMIDRPAEYKVVVDPQTKKLTITEVEE